MLAGQTYEVPTFPSTVIYNQPWVFRGDAKESLKIPPFSMEAVPETSTSVESWSRGHDPESLTLKLLYLCRTLMENDSILF